ncbi:MAG: MotA/TolQ/ExbB proton channel family protein [Oscillospiraceae bacterium]|nr:MotA/TolQ/ExbB proton channel family protein [Oscillospiraceae bacterium]
MKKVFSSHKIFITSIVLTLFPIVNIAKKIYLFFLEEETNLSLGDIVNLVFIIAMLIVIFFAEKKCLSVIKNISDDFENYSYKVEKIGSRFKDIESGVSFKIPELTEAWKIYLNEKKRIQSNKTDFISCDIADYINISLINRTMCKNMCESVPGIMTGLGILGTFVGLLFGLQGFDIYNNEIQNSIVALLNGIKTAFFTSIYGVIFSILFNTFYKISYNKMVRAYDKFISEYYAYAVPNTQNEVYSRLISANESQRETMREFADNIGSLMVNKFQESMDAINKGISEFMSKAIVSQEEKLKMLIHEYLNEMNSNIFGGELEQLRETLHTINANEFENSNNIREAVKEICSHTENIVLLNKMINTTVSDTSSYILQLNECQSNIMKMNDTVNDRISSLSELVSDNNIIIEKMAGIQKETSNSVINFNETFQKFDDRVDILFERSEKLLEDIGLGISANYKMITENINDYQEKMGNITKQFADILARNIHNMNEEQKKSVQTVFNSFVVLLNDNIQKNNNHVNALFDRLEKLLEDIGLGISANYQMVTDNANDYQDKIDEITESFKEMLSQNIDKVNDEQKKTAEIVLKSFNDHIAQHNENIQKIDNHVDSLFERTEKILEDIGLGISANNQMITESVNNYQDKIDEITEQFTDILKNNYSINEEQKKEAEVMINSIYEQILHYNYEINIMINKTQKMFDNIIKIMSDEQKN